MLQDASQFSTNIDSMMMQTLGIPDQVIEDEEIEAADDAEAAPADNEVDGDEEDEDDKSNRDEL